MKTPVIWVRVDVLTVESEDEEGTNVKVALSFEGIHVDQIPVLLETVAEGLRA